jgi:hypothetical protein
LLRTVAYLLEYFQLCYIPLPHDVILLISSFLSTVRYAIVVGFD